MTKNDKKLELTWYNKDKSLYYAPTEKKYLWVDKKDPRVSEPRILLEKARYGDKDTENLLIKGDNLLALKALLQNHQNTIKLIYIDPPFASNKDYMRKVELRGLKDLGRIEEDSESIIQQTMYEDIWKRDEYFQFMYERLILLKELLAETGSIYVHLDWHVGHYIKLLMDEIFGQDNFRNELIWAYRRWAAQSKIFQNSHDVILWYSKSDQYTWNQPYEKYADEAAHFTEEDEKGKYRWQYLRGKKYKLYLKEGTRMKDWWDDLPYINSMAQERTGYATQKPEALLERIIKSTSDLKDLVLDCFMGSGTTCAAAQKLGRRWVGVDVNKGAIQVTSKRLQKIIKDQKETKYPTFVIYKVNNYDLRILKTEAKELAIQQYGITKVKTDTFFDGLRDSGELAKIIDFNHPLTLLDLQLIVDELNKRPDEDRDVVVISLGRETKVDAWIEEWNKKQPYKDTRNKKRMRQFIVFDLKDKNFVSYEPSKAEIEIKRAGKDKVKIEITSFISPTIIKRLELEPGLLQKKIPDFRSMIDVVLVDTDYDGEVFKIGFSDVPEKQNDLVKGEYELEISEKPIKVAVKVIDMLGEEVLVTKKD